MCPILELANDNTGHKHFAGFSQALLYPSLSCEEYNPTYYSSTVVICQAGVRMLPLDRTEDSDKDKGVRDGLADGGACSRGQRTRGGLPRPV